MSKLGILAAGGPAPGINSVIAAATIRACVSGIEVLGIRDGFKWLMRGDTSRVTPLDIDAVSRIHYRGGSAIGIARANPAQVGKLEETLESLRRLDIDRLVTIGGDGTAFTAMSLQRLAGDSLRVVHVPKTIDNDLDLPDMIPTFGYQTARHVGVRIVKDIMTDAKTTGRWYFIVTMGRAAGHLALGVGKSAGCTLTVIAEEFRTKTVPLSEMVDVLVGAIIKRRAEGRDDGVAILAEGLIEKLDPAELAELPEIERDIHGNLRLAEVSFGDLIKRRVQARLSELGLKVTIVSKNVGYELRCADPIPFDMEYTRELGYCATKYLLQGGGGAMVTIQRGVFKPIPFSEMLDASTGTTKVRMVDTETESYKIARRYMIRLRRDDFSNEESVARYAEAAGLTPERFREEFEYLVAAEAPPLRLNAVGT
ncbi:MAG: diphosphate--fructose-6-phosphate 1-phosphotransferase [Polyangiaceae bacterium]